MHDTLLITMCQFLILEETTYKSLVNLVVVIENEFKQPYNVSVDRLGNIYVSDFDNGQLIVFQ